MRRIWWLSLGIITLFTAFTFGIQLADLIYSNVLVNFVPSWLKDAQIPFLGSFDSIAKSATAALFTFVGLLLIKRGILPRR